MLCNYNFSADRPLSGQLTVRLQPTSPIKLKQGTYKVVIAARVNMPRRKIRQSFWLGNYDGADDVNYIRDIAVTVSPPSYAASITPQLGSLNVAWFQRGSSGGYEGSWATANATVQLTLKSVDLIP